MKDGLASPTALVNLKTIPGLDGIHSRRDGLHIGALVTLARLAMLDGPQGLREAAASAASPQLRNMGTLGGNLLQKPRCWYFRNQHVPCWRKGGRRCFAFRGENKYHTIFGGGPCFAPHPSDLAVALLALDASVLLVGPYGRRTIPLAEFYALPTRQTTDAEGYHPAVVLAPDELVVEVIVPSRGVSQASAYVKITERGAWDFAVVSAAVAVSVEDGVISEARVALGGVAPIPWRSEAAEDCLAGQPMVTDTWSHAAEMVAEGAKPLEHNAYKVDLVRSAVLQALRQLS
jgi:xanthine dehydrogenase YagS FAD-binding subunit